MNFKDIIKLALKIFNFKTRSIKLWTLALLVAITYSGTDVTFDGRRDILTTDQYNQVMLCASVINSFKDGVFPPRVSSILSDGLGNPYHQFYSPVTHTYIAFVSLILGDLIEGFAVGSILLLALSFVYMFKLAHYFTFSDHCAVVAAFMFVTAPYLSTDRFLRGAFSEYTCFCLLPMALYYNLRALHFRRFKYWLLAVLISSVVLQAHLLIGSFFLLFYSIFIGLYCILSLIFNYYSNNLLSNAVKMKGINLRLKHISRKAFAAASVALIAILLSMWYLGPIALYSDLTMKRIILPQGQTVKSGWLTPMLSVFSVSDSSWNFKMGNEHVSRFQTGCLILTSYIAFIYFFIRRRTTLALPFAITVGFLLLLILRPILFTYPPMKYVDIIQFSYRFLSLFVLGATVSGALVLRTIFKHSNNLTCASKTAISLSLIVLAIVAGYPYVYPRLANFQWIRYMVNTPMIYAHSKLSYGEEAYLRFPPPDTACPDVWTDPERKSVVGKNERAGDWKFSVELQNFYHNSDENPGEMLLDVLYYPGLQKIDVTVDGIPVDVKYDTYWQKRSTFGPFWADEPGPFHGLKLIGVPGNGLLEARIRFTGFSWANWTSFATLIFLVLTMMKLKRVVGNRKSSLNKLTTLKNCKKFF
jgi:hypothetical protein